MGNISEVVRYYLTLLSIVLGVGASVCSHAIVDGENTQKDRWKPVVGVVFGNTTSSPTCGGALVSPTWVLTAAHCVEGIATSFIDVIPSLHDVNSTVGLQRIPVKRVILHPDANTTPLNADIALLELDFPALIEPIDILSDTQSLVGMNATSLGWGLTQPGGNKATILQEVSLPIVSNQVCADAYTGIQQIETNMICAGTDGLAEGICSQDSGGPLIISVFGQDFLVGITSFRLGCFSTISGYARVSALMGFIQQNTGVNAVNYPSPPAPFIPAILDLLLSG